MTYEEFVKKNGQKKVSAGIDNSVALILSKQLPKRYRVVLLFLSWVWILSIPAFICVAIFYKWWVGILLLAIVTTMLFRSTKKSAALFVLSHAIENKEFFNLLAEKDLLIFRENCTMIDREQTSDLSASSEWGAAEDGEDAYYRGDYTTALKKSRPLAEQGHARAQYRLGVMYATGQGVQQDQAEAIKWFHKALKKLQLLAEQGVAGAQFSLGGMYYSGWGVQQDYMEAIKWFRKAAGQGHASAQNNLGRMYATGKGVAQDDAEVVRWFRKAAEQGHASAQCSLGAMYADGQGVPQDDIEAVKWFRKAAEQGEDSAQFFLGLSYEKGKGVAQDDVEAVKWFRKAAKQGNVMAQTDLGWMYANGRGVQKDDVEAVKWYHKAAEQGYASAQNNLGLRYEKGRGVQQDCVVAYKWFSLAAAQGAPGARENLHRVIKIKSILDTGDGSREHPYVVSSTTEEYLVLEHFNKTLMMQALLDIDGKRMDRMVCEDGTEYYFDISAFFHRHTENFPDELNF